MNRQSRLRNSTTHTEVTCLHLNDKMVNKELEIYFHSKFLSNNETLKQIILDRTLTFKKHLISTRSYSYLSLLRGNIRRTCIAQQCLCHFGRLNLITPYENISATLKSNFTQKISRHPNRPTVLERSRLRSRQPPLLITGTTLSNNHITDRWSNEWDASSPILFKW